MAPRERIKFERKNDDSSSSIDDGEKINKDTKDVIPVCVFAGKVCNIESRKRNICNELFIRVFVSFFVQCVQSFRHFPYILVLAETCTTAYITRQ